MQDIFTLEVEEARTLIKGMDMHVDAFKFQMRPSATVADAPSTDDYTVAVVFGHHVVQYQGGYGMDWVAHFEYDLCNGVFDRKFTKK